MIELAYRPRRLMMSCYDFATKPMALTALLAGLASAGNAWAQPTAGKAQSLPTTTIGASFHNIKAEIAATERQREIGLMYRKAMGVNEGMIFVFERAGVQCFWMKNTLIPLSVAFLDDDGTVVNTDEMKAETEDTHCSKRPVRYVLEMNQGWFSKRGIKDGSKLTGELFAKR